MSREIIQKWLSAILCIALFTLMSYAQEDAPETETAAVVEAVEPATMDEPALVEEVAEPPRRQTIVIESKQAVEEELPAPPLIVEQVEIAEEVEPVEAKEDGIGVLPSLTDEGSLSAIRLEPTVESVNVFYLTYKYVIKDRLALGARVTTFTLEDTERDNREDSFLGSITKLEAEQDHTPRVFVNYKFFRFLGVGVTWNQLRAETITHVREEGIPGDMHTDGTIDLEGFLYYVTVRLPNRTRFTPFAEYGVAQYDANFDHDPLWRYSGNNRLMVLEDADSNYYAIGLDVQIFEGLQLNLYYRKMDVDVDARYYLNDDQMVEPPREESTFPMGHYAYGLGLKYAF
ncbi:MAG: hypothetical protein EOM20_00930 [Spartobacteria bacterium]|nr:hypothetical protein [Spartobacteria bacterium]